MGSSAFLSAVAPSGGELLPQSPANSLSALAQRRSGGLSEDTLQTICGKSNRWKSRWPAGRAPE
eukprot:3122703-Alexandrium_andersonii.AAC.1